MIAASSHQMKAIDTATIEGHQVPGILLMEHAAQAVLEAVNSYTPKEVWVVCGSGNNGGDGFAVARLALLRGLKVHIFFLGKEERFSEDAKAMYQAAKGLHIPITTIKAINDLPEPSNAYLGLVLVDALFGIGCTRKLEGLYYDTVTWMNKMKADVIAVDVPSGINSDTGQIMDAATLCRETVTFSLPKIGLFLGEAPQYTGSLTVADIGIPAQVLEAYEIKNQIIESSVLNRLPVRPRSGHKMTFGRVLIIAGSQAMAGAGVLSAMAAYRSGSGLVDVLTHENGRESIQTLIPEAIVHTYEDRLSEVGVFKKLKHYKTILIGPGLDQNDLSKALLQKVLSEAECPLVIDADGLNLLPDYLELLDNYQAPLVITPHIGEMQRLTGHSGKDILEHPEIFATAYSKAHQVVTVLKSHRTVVTSFEDDLAVNLLGNAGMATGGSGDVLAGIITAILGQGTDAYEAAVLGTALHSMAGDLAKEKVGEASLMATDMIEALPTILKDYTK